MAIRKQAQSETLRNSTAATLATHQYGVVYESSVGVIKKASATHNAGDYNVFILQNTPTADQLADVINVNSGGQSFGKVATGAVTIGAELAISTGGLLKLATGGSKFIAKAAEVSTAANDIIVVNLFPGYKST